MPRGLDRIQRGVRSRLARAIAPPPLPPGVSWRFSYGQQPSCQIPYVGFLYERFLGTRANGSFVEIGANDGVLVSNTWGLAQRGWHGWYVEPVPALAELCRHNHAAHPHITVVNTAVAGPGVHEVTLRLAGALTTANQHLIDEYHGLAWARGEVTDEEISVPAITLDELLARPDIPADLDLLVVDVEGFETEVFSTFDPLRHRPKMMIVELIDSHPDLKSTAADDARLGTKILDAGYRIVHKDHINTVFVRNDIWAQAFEPSSR